MRYGKYTSDQIGMVLNSIGEDAVNRILAGEKPTVIFANLASTEAVEVKDKGWHEKDGVIYFNVTSDGTTGSEWIERLKKQGYNVGNYAKGILLSPDFKPTSGVTYEIAVLKGSLFPDDTRITKNIRSKADEMDLSKPNAEAACLIREKFSDEEIEAMGLQCIIVMHEPIKDSDGDPSLLSANRHGDGRWLGAYSDNPLHGWRHGSGFAFVASQVS